MILDDVLIPDNLKNVCFSCNLQKCNGACCVEGDAGAPIEDEEIGLMEDCIDIVSKYIDEESIKIIQQNGIYDYDADGNIVSPLKINDECVFMTWENGHTVCAFEQAWNKKEINFRKPISCHLYPIRLEQEGVFEKWTLHKWDICEQAFAEGEKNKIPLVISLRDALIRRYGISWYNRLLIKWKFDPQHI